MKRSLSEYEKLLNEEKINIIRELKEMGAFIDKNNKTHWEPKTIDMDTVRSDSSDIADRLEVFNDKIALLRQLNNRVSEIDSALEKIKKGDDEFGKCHICGKKIEEDRLEANYAATTCKEHINQ